MKSFLTVILGLFLLIQPLDAQTWKKTKRLTWTTANSWYPSVATDSSNNIHVVWQEETGNDEIYYKRSTNGGVTWTTKRLTWTSGSSRLNAITVDSDSNIHVVWQDITPGNYEIFYKKGIQ